jgi:hypothetical protein
VGLKNRLPYVHGLRVGLAREYHVA